MVSQVIVVGASAGGVEALRSLAAGLPPDLSCPVLVVLHIPAHATSALPLILDRAGPLPAAHARHGEALEGGRIYVAPPDRHLIIVDDAISLSAGPRENGHRPAVDVLFRSAARVFGPAAIGLILSGSLDDGTAGLAAIASRGGLTIVQDPEDALYPGMPLSAAEHVDLDHVVPVRDIPKVLELHCSRDVTSLHSLDVSELMDQEVAMAEFDDAAITGVHPGTPSGFTCPDCAGTLYEIPDATVLRFRCRVGHAWTQESLAAEQGMALETALWTALRGLEEKVELAHTMALRAERDNRPHAAKRIIEGAEDSAEASRVIRDLLEKMSVPEQEDFDGGQQAR